MNKTLFSEMLKLEVAPILKAVGFKHKGYYFRRTKDGGFVQEVHFQRYPWDIPGEPPYRFYVNLRCRREGTPGFDAALDVRLIPPTAKRFPDWWLELSPEEREQRLLLEQLTPEEHQAIEEAAKSIDWLYSSEDDLREVLRLAAKEIVVKGIPYLDAVVAIREGPDRNQKILELKQNLLRWYWGPYTERMVW